MIKVIETTDSEPEQEHSQTRTVDSSPQGYKFKSTTDLHTVGSDQHAHRRPPTARGAGPCQKCTTPVRFPPFLGSAPLRFLEGFSCLFRRALFVLTEVHLPAFHTTTLGAGVVEESGVRSDAAPLVLCPLSRLCVGLGPFGFQF